MTVFPILLIGLIAWLLPALVPRSVPFGVRIPSARAIIAATLGAPLITTLIR